MVTAKKRILSPADVDGVDDKYKQRPDEDRLEYGEILAYINKNVPADMREDYVKFKNGIKLPPKRKEKVVAFLKELINAHREEEEQSE